MHNEVVIRQSPAEDSSDDLVDESRIVDREHFRFDGDGPNGVDVLRLSKSDRHESHFLLRYERV